jgi:hypothetical protein
MNSRRWTSCLALCLALSSLGCDRAASQAAPQQLASAAVAAAPAAAPISEAQLAEEIAATLQACSYDGSPVAVAGGSLGAEPPTDCRDMIAQIMAHTGLPQNFTVAEGAVPNAAAMIVLGPDKLPRRVIAFNPDFLAEVRRATGESRWAPVSIMAHEIGHHLSGHTITPGGSQPPSELEADKFSGFVLYKMGAGVDDATRAILTLGPPTDGPTHPSRDRRARVIAEGWQEACRQAGGDCAGGRSTASARPPASQLAAAAPGGQTPPAVRENLPATGTAGSAPGATAGGAAPTAVAAAGGQRDSLPAPSADAIPSKLTRFVWDETGLVEPEVRAKYEREMFEHARQHGVEIVTLVVGDLHGLSADDYAWAMLRQLRVGKLDVGNGAVLVYAPAQQQVGLAMGPGIALAMGIDDEKERQERKQRMADTLSTIAFSCKNGCRSGASDLFFLASDHFRRDTDDYDWTIRFPAYGDLWTTFETAWDERRTSGARYDPAADPTSRKIARVHGRVVAVGPADREHGARVNTAVVGRGYTPVLLEVAEGHEVMVYVAPGTQALMTGGRLVAGRSYAFVVREQSMSWNPEDTQHFYALSWDLAG